MAPRKAPPKRRQSQSKQPAQASSAASKAKLSTSESVTSEAAPMITRSGRALRQTRSFGHIQQDEEPEITSAPGAKRKRDAPLKTEPRKKQRATRVSNETIATVSAAKINISLGSPITSREPSPESQQNTVDKAPEMSSNSLAVPADTSTNGASPSKRANPRRGRKQPALAPSAHQPSPTVTPTIDEKSVQDPRLVHASVTPTADHATEVKLLEEQSDALAVELHKSPSPAIASFDGAAQSHNISHREVTVVSDTTGSADQISQKERSVNRASSGAPPSVRGSNVANKGEQWRQSQERERRRAQNKRAMAVDEKTIQQLREKRIRREIQEAQEKKSRNESQSLLLKSLAPATTNKGYPRPHIEESTPISFDHRRPSITSSSSEERESITTASEDHTLEEPILNTASPNGLRLLDPAVIQAAASIGVDMVSISAYLNKAEKLILDARLSPSTPTDEPMTETELALLARNEARKAAIVEEAKVIVEEGKTLMLVLKDTSQYPTTSKLLVGNIVDDWKVLERHANDLTKVGLWD